MPVKRSASGYADTVAALINAIEERGLTLFTRIDHAAGARAIGLQLADEEVVVFGNARAGTPLMAADPRIGIELPLRILVWREGDNVLVGYRDPRELEATYDVGAQRETLAQMASLIEAVAAEAAAIAPPAVLSPPGRRPQR